MSYTSRSETRITCNHIGCRTFYERLLPLAETRADARTKGWISQPKNQFDFCPDHNTVAKRNRA